MTFIHIAMLTSSRVPKGYSDSTFLATKPAQSLERR
jgi:hypothetical protein